MRGWATLLVAVLLAALAVYAVLFNLDTVTVNLPFFSWQTKLWAALVGAALVGAAAAAALFAWPLLRASMQARRSARRIAELEREIHGLRTLPIAGENVSSTTPQRL